MSSWSRRKIHVRHPVVVDIGCNCRKPRLASLFSSFSSASKPKPKTRPADLSTTTSSSTTAYASTSTWDPSFTSANASHEQTPSPPPQPQQGRRRRKKQGRVARESVAVVKQTSEPYSEFKESMVQMIVEKDIYGWDDLNDLLHRFLSLNSPRHHHLILHAFADLWNGVFSPPSPLAGDDYAPPPFY
ncbi:hypothetical protein OPV22_020827 [Ensete ventricosum]|uniref:Transcription repressor n=1 Tax=Ensete ventricosum TaxID=4639 RepID=A0AAV8QNY1_ENSVE|nr:hypothetical protein OPV22_020827 [Ensete ventricosum]RWW05198.1 hypothetical protein GW17_00031539 [Ensete ventricosum]